jgi:hypothetical protein
MTKMAAVHKAVSRRLNGPSATLPAPPSLLWGKRLLEKGASIRLNGSFLVYRSDA